MISTLVFWQNCLSQHQLPYIRRICEDNRVSRVVLVSPVGVAKNRIAMGFGAQVDLGDIELVLDPTDEDVKRLYKETEGKSVHLYSGIRANKFVFKWLKIGFAFDVKRGIITELPNTYSFRFDIKNLKPLFLHRLRFALCDKKYAKRIDYVFAMGLEACRYFKSVYSGWSVFPFSYSVECEKMSSVISAEDSLNINIAFVGSISKLKNAKLILEASDRIKDNHFAIHLCGDGSERSDCEAYAKLHDMNNVKFYGFVRNEQIPSILSSVDVLILPSLYDGWGAVVNEALLAGCFVVCSDQCGAKDLLTDKQRGLVFKAGDIDGLTWCLSYIQDNVSSIRQGREERRSWAEKHISPKAIAEYFVDCITGQRTSDLY